MEVDESVAIPTRMPSFTGRQSLLFLSLLGVLSGAGLIGLAAWLDFSPGAAWRQEIAISSTELMALGIGGILITLFSILAVFQRKSRRLLFCLGAVCLVGILTGTTAIVPAYVRGMSRDELSSTLNVIISAHSLEAKVAATDDADDAMLHRAGVYEVVPYRDGSELPAALFVSTEASSPAGFIRLSGAFANGVAYHIHAREGMISTADKASQVRLVMAGDTANSPHRVKGWADDLPVMHKKQRIDGIFLLGDILQHAGDYEEKFQVKVRDPLWQAIKVGIPLFAVLGNHDIYDGFSEEMMRDPEFNMGGKPYYKKVLGNGLVSVFAIDSTRIVDGADQFLWLRDALAQDTSTWRVLLTHHALVASETGRGSDERRYGALSEILSSDIAPDLVVSGHNHYYERLKPVDGVIYLTAGFGSKAKGLAKPNDPRVEAFVSDEAGFVLLTATADSLTIEAIDVHGSVRDHYSIARD